MKTEELIKMAKLEQKLDDHCKTNDQDLAELKLLAIRIETKLDRKTDKSEFVFWRNVLVSGLVVSIFLGVVALLLERYL